MLLTWLSSTLSTKKGKVICHLRIWRSWVLKTKSSLLFSDDLGGFLTCLIVCYLGTLVLTLPICTLWQTCMQKSLECWHKLSKWTSESFTIRTWVPLLRQPSPTLRRGEGVSLPETRVYLCCVCPVSEPHKKLPRTSTKSFSNLFSPLAFSLGSWARSYQESMSFRLLHPRKKWTNQSTFLPA